MVHLAIVRSPYAHAKITNIDTSEALSMPGVVAVITAKDLEQVLANKYPVEAYEGPGDPPEDQISRRRGRDDPGARDGAAGPAQGALHRGAGRRGGGGDQDAGAGRGRGGAGRV